MQKDVGSAGATDRRFCGIEGRLVIISKFTKAEKWLSRKAYPRN
jgi:hypothetical protein